MTTLLNLLAWVMAAVVIRRAFMVIFHMDRTDKSVPTWKFYGFGFSYALLFMAAAGAAIHITEGEGITGDWLFLIASSGLIVCDRRKRIPDTFADKLCRHSKFQILK